MEFIFEILFLLGMGLVTLMLMLFVIILIKGLINGDF